MSVASHERALSSAFSFPWQLFTTREPDVNTRMLRLHITVRPKNFPYPAKERKNETEIRFLALRHIFQLLLPRFCIKFKAITMHLQNIRIVL